MKKQLLFAWTVFFLSGKIVAQDIRCATDYDYRQRVKDNPALEEYHKQIEKSAREWIRNNSAMIHFRSGTPFITIPVVVHVVYNVDSPQQNIPDTAIFSQLAVLNEDFRRLNADTDDVRAVFDTLSADIGIEFCLATVDPDGNATTGITRTATTKTSFEFLTGEQDSVKFTSGGGHDAWPKNEYLNIWTCYMTFFGSPGVLGYSHFPWDTNSVTDGMVIQYNALGRPNFYGNGRTVTHEVGHWLGLFHTWGNEGIFSPGCDSSDYVDDTPNQNSQSNFDCLQSSNTCANESPYWGTQNPPDLVENYLDYSNDTCMCMFSEGQKSRMLYFLNNFRSSLFVSAGCNPQIGFKDTPPDRIHVMVSPNPASERIFVSFSKNIFPEFEIFDLLGRPVLHFSHPEKVSDNRVLLHLQNLAGGYYFLKISFDGQTTTAPVLVKP